MQTVHAYLTDTLGISPERADAHLRAEFVRVDQQIVTDGDRELAAGEKLVLAPPPITEQGQ